MCDDNKIKETQCLCFELNDLPCGRQLSGESLSSQFNTCNYTTQVPLHEAGKDTHKKKKQKKNLYLVYLGHTNTVYVIYDLERHALTTIFATCRIGRMLIILTKYEE